MLLHCQIPQTIIPRDFILDKAHLTQEELEARFAICGREMFNKEVQQANDDEQPRTLAPVEDGVSPMQDFAERHARLRVMCQDMAAPRMKETFKVHAESCNRHFPEAKTVEDFDLLYRTQVYDNKMRDTINTVCNRMWGKECFGIIETQVMKRLNLKYSNQLVSKPYWDIISLINSTCAIIPPPYAEYSTV